MLHVSLKIPTFTPTQLTFLYQRGARTIPHLILKEAFQDRYHYHHFIDEAIEAQGS